MHILTFILLLIIIILWGICICCNIKINNKKEYSIIILLLIMFAFALINEYIEIFCAEYSFSCDKCGDDLAKSYSQYKPNSNTTKQESIYNIQQLTNTIYNNVCWRKFLIMSLIITLLISGN